MPGARTGPIEPVTNRPELDRRWLRGDPDALADVHRAYRLRLERVAFRVLRNQADAEDVVQRVFLALPAASFRGAATLWSYLYRAAVNSSVNLLRARRRRDVLSREVAMVERLSPPRTENNPEARVLEGEILACVARALLRVKPRHRRVLVLRIKHGFSNVEIARHEQIPPATVATWLRRGREELRVALGPTLRELEGGG